MTTKKFFGTLILLCLLGGILPLRAQDCYWVFFTDKQNTTFDPYSYFDAKAIARYQLNNADLYDISNYPVNEQYVRQVNAIAEEEVGQTRWLNAMAVMATPDEMAQIQMLPFVKKTQLIATDMQLAQASKNAAEPEYGFGETGTETSAQPVLADQLLRMGGNLFRDRGINGKGVRVAVFDGGFPNVNTHKAFKHIRDDHRIIATWNFCDKKENVYGWNGHGTMVLSCIAGIFDTLQMGLATGAEFLLARTEVNTEPYKEEVWWMMAVEWADKNGADVINSSLGYGKDRHYTYEMDGRSYVAHAANMAARKGIVVCNSAGNEGDDNKWKTIITPGDADSILTVGGIEASLSSYKHIAFSSYGPSADGRLKPNVCNFGQATVAKPRTDDELESVFGTSFSSPLTAGFCACVRQLLPNLSAMEVKAEVEKSADLYPYFDYAYGYGVPQASYFLNSDPISHEPTFQFVDKEGYIMVQPLGKEQTSSTLNFFEGDSKPDAPKPTIFFKVTDRAGVIQLYTNLEMEQFGPDRAVGFLKSGLYEKTLTVHYAGYTESFKLSDADTKTILNKGTMADFSYGVIDTAGYYQWDYSVNNERDPEDLKISTFNDHYRFEFSINIGTSLAIHKQQELQKMPTAVGFDFRATRSFRRWYSLGLGLSLGLNGYDYHHDLTSPVAQYLNITSTAENETLTHDRFGLEFFQRIRIVPGGSMTHQGLYWDLGLFADMNFFEYQRTENTPSAHYASTVTYYNDIDCYDKPFSFGVTSRIGYDLWTLYGRYRFSRNGTDGGNSIILAPRRLEIGFMFNF